MFSVPGVRWRIRGCLVAEICLELWESSRSSTTGSPQGTPVATGVAVGCDVDNSGETRSTSISKGTMSLCFIPLCFRLFFPECVARVPVSLWGSWGWRCVHWTLPKRPQPFATVHVRTVWPCLWEVLQEGSFWRFQVWRSLNARGRRGTSWHLDVFRNVCKIVVCGRRNTFVMFSEHELHFSWQAQHSAFCVAGAALQTCRVACFLLSALAGQREVVTKCKFWFNLAEGSRETSILR